jgi:hypothetical protein
MAIDRVLNDKPYRDELIQKGNRRLHDFSWKTTAIQTMEVYEMVLQNSQTQ